MSRPSPIDRQTAPGRRPDMLTGRALCLRRVPYGDSSLVVELLSADHGRVGLLARGAYRPTSRFCGVLDYFHRLELTWRPGSSGGLGLLIAGDRDRNRKQITLNLSRYRAAMACLELTELVSRSGQPEAGLFALLDGTLKRLDRGADALAEGLRFDLLALAELGLAPALRRCGSCGRRAKAAGSETEPAWFSPAAGGRQCPTCLARAGAPGATKTHARLLEGLADLAESRAEFSPPFPGGERGRGLLDRFLEQHLESRPRSLLARLPGDDRKTT
jgi:DNA repair protein RecO (recombination protein O)